jgi:hypothetical protein
MSGAFCGAGSAIQFATKLAPSVYTTVAEAVTIKRSGGKREDSDVTNMQSPSAFREYIPTLLTAGEIQVDGNFVPADPGQDGVTTLFLSGDVVNWRLELPNSFGYFQGQGFVVEDRNIDVPVDKKVVTSFKVKITGPFDYHLFGS